MASGAENRLDDVGVEATRPDIGAELGGSLVRRALGPVRARLAHRLVGVGGGEDAGRAGDRGAGEPARIARAVEALAVLYRDRTQRREHR